MNSAKKRVRWWPLIIIAILAGIAIGVLWGVNASERESKVFLTIFIFVCSLILGVLWLLFLSRLPWRARLLALLAFVGCVAICGALFRYGGVTGALTPIVEWRWGNKPVESVTSENATGISTPTTDFPQFLGPDRNAVIKGIRLARDWEKHPPKLIWRQPVGAGWSAFAISGDSAITQEQEGEWEKVVCYELMTGAVRWSHRDSARYDSALAGLGPRATPTIVGNRVYTVGSTGIFNCLDFETGEQLWTTNIFEENNAEPPSWGVSISPLVLGDLVIVSAGGPVAYHKESGEVVWRGHRTNTGYSSPFLTTLVDTEQIVIFNQGLVTAHEPATGKLLWQQPWPPGQAECVSQPLPLPGDKLFVSTAYGIGGKLFQLERNQDGQFNVSLAWETIFLKAKFTTVLHYGGYLYGLDDGIFACLNLADGKRQWKRGRYGHGQVLLVEDVILVLTESGDVVLIEPNPEALVELTRFTALEGRTWNTPALAAPYLLVRNGQEAACYQLPIVGEE